MRWKAATCCSAASVDVPSLLGSFCLGLILVALITSSLAEIWMHSPSVAAGYWGRPDATESTVNDAKVVLLCCLHVRLARPLHCCHQRALSSKLF